MDFIRLFLLMALLLFSVAAVDRSRSVINASRVNTKAETLTAEDSVIIQAIAELALVQPVSIVVQDGVRLGTGSERVAEVHDPTAHAEIEAIRDACRRAKTVVLRNGVLYASRQPCSMCMHAIAQTGISKVVIAPTSHDHHARVITVPR